MSLINQESSNCHRSGARKRTGDTKSSSAAVRQQSQYAKSDKPIPDNNPFFEERSNSLSSKGN